MSQIRRELREQLSGFVSRQHRDQVALVATELMEQAIETLSCERLTVEVRLFRLLTDVRVTGHAPCGLPTQIFDLRERVLRACCLAFGHRLDVDGSVVLWAEVVRDRESAGTDA